VILLAALIFLAVVWLALTRRYIETRSRPVSNEKARARERSEIRAATAFFAFLLAAGAAIRLARGGVDLSHDWPRALIAGVRRVRGARLWPAGVLQVRGSSIFEASSFYKEGIGVMFVTFGVCKSPCAFATVRRGPRATAYENATEHLPVRVGLRTGDIT
jgi:hypothetical protein